MDKTNRHATEITSAGEIKPEMTDSVSNIQRHSQNRPRERARERERERKRERELQVSGEPAVQTAPLGKLTEVFEELSCRGAKPASH